MEIQEIMPDSVIPSKFKKFTPFIVIGVGLGLIALINTRKTGGETIADSPKMPNDVTGVFKDAINQNNEQLSKEFGETLERNQELFQQTIERNQLSFEQTLESNKTMYDQTINQLRQESESTKLALSSQIQQLQNENSAIASSYNNSFSNFAGMFSSLASSVSNMQSEIETVKTHPISYVVSEVQTPVTTPTVTQSVTPSPSITQTTPKPSTPSKVQEPIINIQQIAKGDTLTSIAKKYNTTVNAIMKENPQITNSSKIYAGDMIVIPK